MDRRFLEPNYSQSMPADWFELEVTEIVSDSILSEITVFGQHNLPERGKLIGIDGKPQPAQGWVVIPSASQTGHKLSYFRLKRLLPGDVVDPSCPKEPGSVVGCISR
jgi:hypothetical protein